VCMCVRVRAGTQPAEFSGERFFVSVRNVTGYFGVKLNLVKTSVQ
jgi:hypothetical protein